MADLTRGVTLAADEEVTHTKMEQGIESATVSDIARVDMDSTATTVSIGTSAPTANPVPVAGHLWYDTTNKVLMEYDATDWRAVSRASNFTNRSGGALSAGDVVILDTGNNRSVTTTTTVANADVIGVVLVGGDNLASVVVITEGYCPKVTVTGSTTPGDYLFTSLTAKKADPINSASNGSFGRAISTSATNVKALLGGCVMAVNASGFVASVVDTVSFTKNTGSPTGTTVVSHTLGKIPSFIQFNGYFDGTVTTNCYQGFCTIQDDTPTTKQMVAGSGESSAQTADISDYCCIAISNDSNYMRGQVTAVTSTNFTITWSEVGTVATADLDSVAMVFA
jgi:hypothetical protein